MTKDLRAIGVSAKPTLDLERFFTISLDLLCQLPRVRLERPLVNSLELARGGRAEAEAALAQIGLPEGVRAEALAPEQLLKLSELLP